AFSNYGRILDLVAQGETIRTSHISDTYASVNGTSYAAPIVSGVEGLILARNPTFTPDEIEQVILETATDLGAADEDDTFGAGLVDVLAAVTAAASGGGSFSQVDNSKLDFQLPKGPVVFGQADQQVQSGATS